jgi:DNA polymerase type B, organellar and viral
MGDLYDPSKPVSYIKYLDANNLYGWAMNQLLPVRNFVWIDVLPDIEDNITAIKNCSKNGRGSMLEVDLEYPKHLHDSHNDYPLAPEHLNIRRISSSAYTTKLVPNLMDKTKYICHYRNLLQYISLGLKVTKIHRILQFDEEPVMRSYIMLNTNMRKQADKQGNKFGVEFFKLMNNSVFGKTMENIENRVDIRLVSCAS